MTEKEKMLNGELYLPDTDKTLFQERMNCKILCHQYNSLSPDKLEERKSLVKQIVGKTQEKFHIEQPLYCDYGYNIEIGENFYSNHNIVILDCAKVKFGDNVFIGPNCGFYTAEHPLDAQTRNKGLEYAKPIIVGNNVWFGGGVQVVAGVTIGNNVVIGANATIVGEIEIGDFAQIGAGAVIAQNVPAGCTAVSQKARIIFKE